MSSPAPLAAVLDDDPTMPDGPVDFSLIQGGPFFQLLVRTGMLDPPTGLLARRIVGLLVIAWLPLVLLSALTGRAFGGVAVPFFHDLGEQVRFLLCVPLLLAADVVVHRRIGPVVGQFLERGVVAPADRPRFRELVASAMRLRNSMVAELLILAVAIAAIMFAGRYNAMSVTSWAAVPVDGQMRPTAAGYWNTFVSLTIFRFLLVRWYFRLLIWGIFLARVAWGLPLRLNALHPDRAAGLGFLSGSIYAFAPILLVHTITLSGSIANKILHEGAKLPQFKVEIAAWIVALTLLVVAPLLAFVTRLAEARRVGLRDYGIVASRYVGGFRRKWVEGQGADQGELLGTGDIQSLADLSNSFEVVRGTGLVPVGLPMVARLILVMVIPLLPLTLTMVPLGDLIDRAVRMLL